MGKGILLRNEVNMVNRTIKRYSDALRRQVVREYEEGSSIPSLRKKYGIRGTSTIQRWIKKFSQKGLRHNLVRLQTMEEGDRLRELETQVQELEQALGKITLEKLALESTLEVLQETYGLEPKKNARGSSNGSGKKPVSKQGSE
jgi:transposase-like protein